ncbi:MAG: LytR/AlgR family response regulator transcription factor [Eubacterium sp.]
MRIAICDDDMGCCSQLEKWLLDYKVREKVDIQTDIFYSAETLLCQIKNRYWFDLIFLDIELPQRTGIELGHAIRNYMKDDRVSIIFISGKTDYCQELFELEPQNFYHKPLKEEVVIKDLDKAIRRWGYHKKVLRYIEDGVPKGIVLGDILYVEAKNKAVEIMTKDDGKIIIRDSLSRIAEEFKDYQICQCHRSFVVNLFFVEKFFNNVLYMKNGNKIPVGRKYANNVKNSWASYEGGYY